METPLAALNRIQAAHVITSLKQRAIPGLFVKDSQEARAAVLGLIPPGSVVGVGGSMTILDMGLLEPLRSDNYKLLDRFQPGITTEQEAQLRRKALTADIFLTSANAITLSGKIVCVDGAGSRVGPIIFGPKKVIFVVGVNKIVSDLPQAFDRIRTIAGPANCIRFSAQTPCARTGLCQDEECLPPGRLCNAFIILEGQRQKDRINVILVGQDLGF